GTDRGPQVAAATNRSGHQPLRPPTAGDTDRRQQTERPWTQAEARERYVGIVEGKRLLITGVITDASIAFAAARVAQEQGAEVVLTGFGRMSLVERIANRLPKPPPLVELDVTNDEHLDTLADRVRAEAGLDGLD